MSNGTVTISQSGILNITNTLYIGNSGTGSLTIKDNATVSANQIILGDTTGLFTTTSGTLNLQGGTLRTSGLRMGAGATTLNLNGGTLVATADNNNFFNNIGNLYISGSTVNSSTTVFTFDTNGFNVTATNNFIPQYGNNIHALQKIGDGTLTLSGNNTLNAFGLSGDLCANGGVLNITGSTTNYFGKIGELAEQSATVNVSGFWQSNAQLLIGTSGNGNLIINGGTVSNGSGLIGYNSSGVGSVTVNGGLWQNDADCGVGFNGSGSLTINSGTVSDTIGGIGAGAVIGKAGAGTAIVNGGLWQSSSNFYVATSGSGNLIINGGTVSNGSGFIGRDATGIGNVIINDGLWQNNGDLFIGRSGTGSLTINGGTVSNYSGYISYNNGVGSVVVNGLGVWRSEHLLSISGSGNGSLTLNGHATIITDQLTIGNTAGYQGILTIASDQIRLINTSGNAVAIDGPGTGSSGTGTINFTHSGTLTMNNSINGYHMTLNHNGTGTTTLTGTLSYNGNTNINTGTLLINGDASTLGGINVNNGGALGRAYA
jgi:T5SS/PEP-CTERM-associated repeat protein/autotransporter-associated beta strand protein